MVEYLTHYYVKEIGPFRSLSELSDEAAIKIMEERCDDSPYGTRFKDPARYLKNRKETENWVRMGFIAKGGKPQASYPIPMVLGSSKWLDKNGPERGGGTKIRIPLSIFTEHDISFTYPDSMISRWFGLEKPTEYYLPDLHGKIFTLMEIRALVNLKGLPEDGWQSNLPRDFAPYIEAQVWRHEPLMKYRQPLI